MSMNAGLILFIYFKDNVIISLCFRNMKISIDHLSMIPITGVPILKGEGSVYILLELYI